MNLDEPQCLLDCLIVGGGPAGLTAALYLARFKRSILVVDAGRPRAAWIPTSHNIPLLPAGVSGRDLLKEMRASAELYGARIEKGQVSSLEKHQGSFRATWLDEGGRSHAAHARRVLLASGSQDMEPDLPGLPEAVERGLVRYCPICDGFEASGRSVAVLGPASRALAEAIFIARTYSDDVTVLALEHGTPLSEKERREAADAGIRLVEGAIRSIGIEEEQGVAVQMAEGAELRFGILYSALGMRMRSDLAVDLGAEHDEAGALLVGDHNRTSVPGLYAAGDVVRGLSQIVVAMGHAAVAATDIHNRCHHPTEEEPEADDGGLRR